MLFDKSMKLTALLTGGAWLYFCYDRYYCEAMGPSMYPTLNVLGERLIVAPVHPSDVRKGDLVVLKSPSDPNRKVIKRIVVTAGNRAPDPLAIRGIFFFFFFFFKIFLLFFK